MDVFITDKYIFGMLSLPYKPETFHKTLQVFHGQFSHKAPLEYGVDFEMKEQIYMQPCRELSLR
jgi:hypothetical protein